jgi:cobalt-zinc-cadmium resistance protein CzcA
MRFITIIEWFSIGIGVPILFSGNISNQKLRSITIGSKKENEEQKREQFVNQKKNELAKYQEINYYHQYGKSI